MIAIKSYHQSIPELKEYQREAGIFQRFGFNRCLDGITSDHEIVKRTGHLKNINLLDTMFQRANIRKGISLYLAFMEKPIEERKIPVFGGYKNIVKMSQGKITKEQWKECRLAPIVMEGDKNKKGNRKFELHIETKELIFKPARNIKFSIPLNVGKRHLQLLKRLQQDAENKLLPFSVELLHNQVSIAFEPSKLSKETVYSPIKNRTLAIDSNPNRIGLSVTNNKKNKVVFAQQYELPRFNTQNQRKHWLLEISKSISETAKHYRCEKVIVEKLDIESSNKGKGKTFNRLCNNEWTRNLLFNNLEKRCNLIGIEFKKVFAAYSSFVGNIQNGLKYGDPVSASIELNRRGKANNFEESKAIGLFPAWDFEALSHQWKDAVKGFKKPVCWKEFYGQYKTSGVGYRVAWQDVEKHFVKSKFKVYKNGISSFCMF